MEFSNDDLTRHRVDLVSIFLVQVALMIFDAKWHITYEDNFKNDLGTQK